MRAGRHVVVDKPVHAEPGRRAGWRHSRRRAAACSPCSRTGAGTATSSPCARCSRRPDWPPHLAGIALRPLPAAGAGSLARARGRGRDLARSRPASGRPGPAALRPARAGGRAAAPAARRRRRRRWLRGLADYGNLQVSLSASMLVGGGLPRFTRARHRGKLDSPWAGRAGRSSSGGPRAGARVGGGCAAGLPALRRGRERRPAGRADATRAFYAAVGEAIRGRGANPVPAAQAVATMAVLETVVEAARLGHACRPAAHRGGAQGLRLLTGGRQDQEGASAKTSTGRRSTGSSTSRPATRSIEVASKRVRRSAHSGPSRCREGRRPATKLALGAVDSAILSASPSLPLS